MKKSMLAFGFGILLVAAGCAQRNGGDGASGIGAYDVDTSGYLDQNEFCAGIQENDLLTDWDADKNAVITAEEVSSGIFDVYDTDDNGYLNADDWAELNNAVFETDYAFSDWDSDNNSVINETEFQVQFSENSALDAWDEDGNAGLNNEEFCSMAFSVADVNTNDQVDLNEWNDFSEGWF